MQGNGLSPIPIDPMHEAFDLHGILMPQSISWKKKPLITLKFNVSWDGDNPRLPAHIFEVAISRPWDNLSSKATQEFYPVFRWSRGRCWSWITSNDFLRNVHRHILLRKELALWPKTQKEMHKNNNRQEKKKWVNLVSILRFHKHQIDYMKPQPKCSGENFLWTIGIYLGYL